MDEAPGSAYEELAVANGMVPMFHDGLRKVRRGLTTIEEVMAVCEQKAVELPAEEITT